MGKLELERLLRYDAEHILHSLGYGGENLGIVFMQADGIRIRDSEGKDYIDCGSQLVNVNLGHNRRDIIEAATVQMSNMAFVSILRGYSDIAAIEYARRLAQVVPEGLDHFLFTMTGGDANDCAFKIANMYYRVRKERRYKIISLFNSYHGTLRGTGGATGINQGTMSECPPCGSHIHIPNYFCYRCPFHKEYPDCGLECAQYLDYMIENEGKDSVCCFIVEPEQGAGGFISPPAEYFPLVREICDKHDVLLIADEVMTGFGRTGRMFGLEHWNIKPDIMTLSKGIVNGYLPFGVVAISEEIFRTLEGEYLGIGSTETGNPVCCAVGSKVIDIIQDEHILENVDSVGSHVKKRLEEEFLPLPHVGTISGLGLMLGVHIVTNKEAKSSCSSETEGWILRRGLESGLYLRMAEGSLQFAPPLVITQEEADEALNRLYQIIAGLELK